MEKARFSRATPIPKFQLVVVLALLVIAGQIARAQTLTVLHTFTGENGDGAAPYAGLIFDAKGNLYGTTYYGGRWDAGTVFEIAQSGSYQVLYDFINGGDGPAGSLLKLGKNIYGTTFYGGIGPEGGYGTVFELAYSPKKKTYKGRTIYEFQGGPDGARPYGNVVADAQGNLYGTTTEGGAGGQGTGPDAARPFCNLAPQGTVFEVTRRAVREMALHSFTGYPDGDCPYAGLVRDANGNLYGTTYSGGNVRGTVFKLAADGTETVLYTFLGAPDGDAPWATLILDHKGNLYGTTQFGGTGASCGQNVGCGTVFEITTAGTEKVLYSFQGTPDGSAPEAGLIMDSKGNLYGTTVEGGTGTGCGPLGVSCGTVFELVYSKKTQAYTENVLYNFTGGSDGGSPQARLVMDRTGNLYGTTEEGGDLSDCYRRGCGTVFKLTP